MASGIAHEFNNLLIAMLGFTSLLQATLQPASQSFWYVVMIEDLADRASELARQLMYAARNMTFDNQENEPIDVNTAVNEVLQILSHMVKPDIQLATRLQEDPPLVDGNSGQIQQVVMNLILNALDAMPGGGQLAVSTSTVNLEEGQSEIRLSLEAGRYVELSVGDTGIGISEQIKHKIFEPFSPPLVVKNGTGLGSSVVQGIVKNHHGAIKIENNNGGVTVFIVYLPIWSLRRKWSDTRLLLSPREG